MPEPEPQHPEPIAIDPGAARARKRSVLIAGHATSISLEDIFWRHLTRLAEARGQSINALVAEIDAARTGPSDASPDDVLDPPSLSGALRVWVMTQIDRQQNPRQTGAEPVSRAPSECLRSE